MEYFKRALNVFQPPLWSAYRLLLSIIWQINASLGSFYNSEAMLVTFRAPFLISEKQLIALVEV